MPVVGRHVPVIADERVEIDFGTGALKITPGHDPIDFDIGRDHDLPVLTIVGPDGRMTAEGFEGLDAGRGRRARRRVADASTTSSRSASTTGTRSAPASAATRGSSRSSRRSGGARWTSSRAPAIEALQARARRLPPGEPAPLRDRVARAGARLVRLAPAVVGPPDPDLDVSRRPPDVHVAGARRVRGVRLDRARARPRRARHVVLVGAVAVRDARLAARDAGARALLPGRRQRHGARDHPPLGEPDDLLRPVPARRDPVHAT